MKMSEKEIKEFEKQNKEIFKLVCPIKENPELVKATEKVVALRERLAEVQKIIIKNDKDESSKADAQRLLDGKPLKAQTASQDFIREKKALENAIQNQSEIIRKIKVRLVAAGCLKLRDIAENFAKETLDAAEALDAAIRKNEAFYDYLSAKRYHIDMRPAHWRFIPHEQQILHTLASYIESRRTAWGFNAKIKK